VEFPHLLNFYRGPVRGYRQEIGMISAVETPARNALPAGIAAYGGRAIHKLRQRPGGSGFSHARRPAEQHGVRDSA
jgi:hypothetical protein